MRAIGKYNHRANQKAVVSAREVYCKVWASACNFDSIPSISKFVIFPMKIHLCIMSIKHIKYCLHEFMNTRMVGMLD